MARLESTIPPYDDRVAGLKTDLAAVIKEADDVSSALQAFATRPALGSYQRGVDLLVLFFDDPHKDIARAAVETYVRRMYSAHDMLKVEVAEKDGSIEVRWWYKYRSSDPSGVPLRFGKLVRCFGDSPDAALASVKSTILPAYIQDVESGKEGYADIFGDAPAKDDAPVNTLHILLKGAFLDSRTRI